MAVATEDIQGHFASITSRLDPGELAAFAAVLVRIEVPDRTMLIREGEASESLYLLREGQLVVHIDAAGRPIEVGRLQPGDLLGEISLMDPGAASATVTAVGPASVLQLARASLELLAIEHPHVATVVLHALCAATGERLEQANRHLEEVMEAVEPTPVEAPPPPAHGFRRYFQVLFGPPRG